MKKLNRILVLSLLFTAFISCEKTNNSTSSDSTSKTATVTLESATITDRIEYSNQPLFNAEYDLLYNANNVSSKSASTVRTSEVPTLLERGEMFVHIADVASPVRSDDRVLSATQVCLNNDYAYVSYHYNENDDDNFPSSKDLYEGQVEILDVSDPTTPIIKSAAKTDVADFNTMCFDVNSTDAQQKLWIGATDYNVGGVVYELNLSNNELFDGETLIRHKATGSYSVNGVASTTDYLFATGGRTSGGNYIFDASTAELIQTDSFSNAKFVVVTEDGDKQIVLTSGDNAQLFIYSTDKDHTLLDTIDLGSIQPESGKSGLFIKDNICWVPAGTAGLKAYNIETGNLVHSLSIEDSAVCNGVALDDDFIYVANGAGGIAICEAIEGQEELNVLDTYSYGASANAITVQDDLIYIANGRNGLKILRRVTESDDDVVDDVDEDGVPESVEVVEICSTLKAHLAVTLPEYKNEIAAHPEYFAFAKTIVLKDNATVSVSFIDEGASFKNSFGTYTYDINTPATAADISNKQIVFPNASKVGSGGKLVPGSNIELGTYPAGTNIGGFLMANSWVGKDKIEGGIKEGYYTHYTNPILNSNQLQQTLIFYDQECEAIVMCFEDVKTTGGDKDFNDCVMQIIINPASAVDVNQFIQIVQD